MATTPTYEQVLNAVMSTLQSAGLTGTFLYFENRRASEAELIREYRQGAPDYEAEITLVDADAEEIEGKCQGEDYVIYKVRLRHLYTKQDETDISRIAKFRANLIREAVAANPDVFRIGGQVPLRTSEVVTSDGNFVDREDSRYYETNMRFEVEARRWE